MATEHGCVLWTIARVCDVMYGPCSQEENTADSQVGEQHEEPDSWREGIEEGEVARLPALVHTWSNAADGQKQTHGRTDRQTDRETGGGVREQGVTSQQKGYVRFAPQEGSVPHSSLAPHSFGSLMHYSTIHKRPVSQWLSLNHTWQRVKA